MKLTFKTMLTLTVGAGAMILCSCNEEEATGGVPTQQELETKIIGKWKLATDNGQDCLTDKKMMLTFSDNHQSTSSSSRVAMPFNEHQWVNKQASPYQIKGNILSWTKPGHPDYKEVGIAIDAIDDKAFTYNEYIMTNQDGVASTEKGSHTYRRVTADYSRDILGVWEGVSLTGDETYGSAEARIAYYDDDTYTYYRKIADVWYPTRDNVCEYNVDGDWLATRWMPEETEGYNYEWWDIDAIKDGTMQWSALREREDGSRYNTTFTWKKVDDFLTAEQIMAKLPGKWAYNHMTETVFIKGEIVSTNSQDLKPNTIYTYTADGKSVNDFYSRDGQTLETTIWSSYTVKGNLITEIIENVMEDGVEYDFLNGRKDVTVVHSITDDYLTILSFGQYDEVDEDFGGDALLLAIRFKRVELNDDSRPLDSPQKISHPHGTLQPRTSLQQASRRLAATAQARRGRI